jgi:hypothetical protein
MKERWEWVKTFIRLNWPGLLLLAWCMLFFFVLLRGYAG